MAEIDDPADAAERLARALDRIAAAAGAIQSPVAADSHHGATSGQSEAEAEVARRLDALIARIRAVLGPQAGG